jgi:hypothetical protein
MPFTPVSSASTSRGWDILDAESDHASGESIFWLPAREERERIGIGEHAKLVFVQWDDRSASTDTGGKTSESMWVKITDHGDGVYRGTLDNKPTLIPSLHLGDLVVFSPRNVVDIRWANDTRASEEEGVIACPTHGPSVMTLVCEHLAHGAAGQGFNTALERGPGEAGRMV